MDKCKGTEIWRWMWKKRKRQEEKLMHNRRFPQNAFGRLAWTQDGAPSSVWLQPIDARPHPSHARPKNLPSHGKQPSNVLSRGRNCGAHEYLSRPLRFIRSLVNEFSISACGWQPHNEISRNFIKFASREVKFDVDMTVHQQIKLRHLLQMEIIGSR